VTNVVYVFDCPYHGRESGVLCFRAFEEKNRKHWKKLQVQTNVIPLSEEDLDTWLEAIKSTSMNYA